METAMNKPEDLDGVLRDLYRRRAFGIKPGLDGIRRLLDRLGRPQDGLRYIHVAGTVGKGAVCAMLDAMLRAGGCRCGLYTSPHLVRFNERFVLDGELAEDAVLFALATEVEAAAQEESRASGYETTFFEFATAMAFLLFKRSRLDWVVLETGLGGRLDATNVVRPALSVITRIGMEHMAYLGHTLELITVEKCGIIKPGVPVVCGAMEPASVEVVARVARERGSAMLRSEDVVSISRRREEAGGQRLNVQTPSADYGLIHLPLAGGFQAENLATAVTAIEALRLAGVLLLEDAAVKDGLASIVWNGRFQCIGTQPEVLLDGAHCPPAAQALAVALKARAARRPVGFVLGFSGDKDIAGFVRPLRSLGRKLWLAPIRRESGADPEVAAAIVRREGFDVAVGTLEEGLRAAKAWALQDNGLVCVTGSLYLVGEMVANSRGQVKDLLTEA